jgi:hypothetical protein
MVEKDMQINRPAIYAIFTDKWLQRENWRRSIHKSDRLYFCKQLALYFYTNKQNSVHWSDLPNFIKEYFKDKVKTHTELDIFDTDIRTSNFLKRKEDSGQYSFIHKSFMEYFVGRFFHENIRKRISNGLDQLKDFIKSKVIYEFLVDMLDKKDIDTLLKDVYKTESYDYSKLMSGNEKSESRLYYNPESLGNCVYLLVQKGYNLDKAILDSALFLGFEFENTSFDGASLRGASFKNCNLANIKFNNAILPYANFENAKLQNVDFTGAMLDKVDFRNAMLDNKTIISIAKSQHWGSVKLSTEQRKRIDRAYTKPSDSISYTISEQEISKF